MKKFFILLPVLLCVLGISFVDAAKIQEDLSKNLLRLHIVANSDEEFDQNTKLLVRDNILKNINEGSTLKDLTTIANSTLSQIKAGYTASAKITKCYVPKKDYKNISLPEGVYSCLNVTLGKGEGKNWWCIAYPPLCFTESVIGEISPDGQSILIENLDKKTFDAIVNSGNVNFRFKILELFQKIRCNI